MLEAAAAAALVAARVIRCGGVTACRARQAVAEGPAAAVGAAVGAAALGVVGVEQWGESGAPWRWGVVDGGGQWVVVGRGEWWVEAGGGGMEAGAGGPRPAATVGCHPRPLAAASME